ncbi:formylglycine-generating enzyme family protein [Peptoniphilus sp. MSJ-1]|uniref:Formylglycine-generating enzyme family protein n=1 Tax=Peptoniphilus ovalis TaxID=2841503 RepID=A0ABS6FE31_9FIRM|nr:formylglycine-generating enzyme family protein [Peptoniphilus ovalis]MBU5668439.1 formylglycine-generating enzyme family protein [Peptoniphilus ovalis]
MKNEMIALPGGKFKMGCDLNEGFEKDMEGPSVEVEIEPFEIMKFTVTNEEFLEFFLETGYVTEAERYGSSFVFHYLLDPKKSIETISTESAWVEVQGASWRKPTGDGSSIEDKMNHPVVHISYNDAMVYANWKGLRLPTEAEWEYAARAGTTTRFPWGDELVKNKEHMANTYQGEFPNYITDEDGYIATAPVDSYYPNDFGLYQVCGNVYEWCINDGGISLNEFTKKDRDEFVKENQNYTRNLKSLRGGSFLCSPDYCKRYRVASRNSTTANSSACNIGFRLVRSL